MKDLYLEKIKEYCLKNGISTDKLDKQEKRLINKSFIVAQPIELSNSDGLKTDLLSQPKPTLIYNIDSGQITETEYTNLYLR